jgi:hypothetical protein
MVVPVVDHCLFDRGSPKHSSTCLMFNPASCSLSISLLKWYSIVVSKVKRKIEVYTKGFSIIYEALSIKDGQIRR